MLGDISLATNTYIVTGYTDIHKSIDVLCAIILEQFDWLMFGLEIEQPKALRTA